MSLSSVFKQLSSQAAIVPAFLHIYIFISYIIIHQILFLGCDTISCMMLLFMFVNGDGLSHTPNTR